MASKQEHQQQPLSDIDFPSLSAAAVTNTKKKKPQFRCQRSAHEIQNSRGGFNRDNKRGDEDVTARPSLVLQDITVSNGDQSVTKTNPSTSSSHAQEQVLSDKGLDMKKIDVVLQPVSGFLGQGKNVNDDIFFSILVFLPVAKAREFKLVCKSWYHMIKSPAFVQTHLCKAKHGLIFSKTNGTNYMVYNDKIPLRVFDEMTKTIWNSCNGLMLFDQIVQPIGRRFLFIENPAIKEASMKIPSHVFGITNLSSESSMKLPSPYQLNDEKFSHVFGITYFSSIKRYVVVHYYIMKEESPLLGNFSSTFGCETLSVSDDGWKCVNHMVLKNTRMEFFKSQKVIFINDVAHVVVFETINLNLPQLTSTLLLISVNMIDRKYYKRKMPVHHHEDLFEIRGVLSYARLSNDADFEIWSLEDFRKGDWVMHTRIETGVNNAFVGSVVAILEGGNFLVASYYENGGKRRQAVGYFVYDIRLKKTTYLKFKPHQAGCRVLSHVDSHVSCR